MRYSTFRKTALPPYLNHSETSIEFRIGNNRYVALPSKQHESFVPGGNETTLFTVISVSPQVTSGAKWLRDFNQKASREDDVFHTDFLEGIVIHTEQELQDEAKTEWNSALKSIGVAWSRYTCGTGDGDLPETGPYLWSRGCNWRICRLYDDIQGAFMTALDPKPQSEDFVALHFAGVAYQTWSVAVPSRISRYCSGKRRLEGLRFVVKDCWRMQGLRNTMENLAFYDVDEPAMKTAAIVRKLTENGALPLGMAKLSCFAGREEPAESTDYQLPFNPRGEGYQSPAGSSNGCAAAVAAYDWVDIGIGTDTTGSGRRPAFVNGCFALRPSHNIVSLDGLIPTFKRFDTPCLLGRNLSVIEDVASVIFDESILNGFGDKQSLEPRIILPLDYFPVKDTEQMRMIDMFVKDLEKVLNVTHEKVSITDEWKMSATLSKKSESLEDFMQDVATDSFLYAFYHSFDEFRSKYLRKHERKPFVTAFTQWRWDVADEISPARHEIAIERIELYRLWFLEKFMNHRRYNTFLILPIDDAKPNYRNEPPKPFFKQSALDALFLAPILKSPELVVPIGQLPYLSRVSDRIEKLPVAVSVLGVPGSDIALIDMIQKCLVQSGRPSSVEIGSVMFREPA